MLTMHMSFHFVNIRTAVQVKTHGQVILKRIAQGEDVFAELDRFELSVDGTKNPSNTLDKDSILNLQSEDLDAAHILVIMRK